ncbi:unnamed protein product [Auanema sp. JU1783]|nr:unnamed protein product [Auanema sp. JU1783]
MERYNYRYNHLRNGASIRPYVQATTTNMIKDDFTKSLHELRAFEPIPTNDNHERYREYKSFLPIKPLSTFNLTSIKHRNESKEQLTRLDNTDDRPVLRRKRFTRRQRKSVTIEPETGLILAAGPPSSSDEDESSRIIRKKSPLRQQPKSISASTFELHLNQACDIKNSPLSNTSFAAKSAPRGPSARRAGRRLGKLQYKNAASTNNLDEISEAPFSLKPEKRSMSVRDLNGEECDFSNRDSVVKWTSQILAELNSLPSSCIDLTQESLVNNDRKDRKWSTLQSPADPPPIPPHLSLNARMTQSTFIPFADDSCTWHEAGMTSSVHSDWKPAHNGSRRLSSISNVVTPILEDPKLGWNTNDFTHSTPEIMSMEARFPSSLQDLRTMIQDDSDDSRRDREDSLNTSTLVGSSSDSDTGTPLALSPVPMDIVDFPMLSEKISSTTGTSSPLERRSIGVQGPETPLFYCRVSTDIDSPMTKSAFAPLQIVLSDEATNEKHILSTGSLPLPNKQPAAPEEHVVAEEQSKASDKSVEEAAVTDAPAIRMRQTIPSANRYESVLLKNIERLSKTAVEKNNPRYSQISNIMNMEDNFGSEETLNKWKKRAECRSRIDISNAAANEVPSVDRVIASLIRTVEETRFTAPDRPQSLGIDQLKPQDATTQTSPYSISRSSSFDWINDMSEGRLRDLNTPVCTPKTDASVSANYISKNVESSSETDDADREVAEVTRNAILCDQIVAPIVPQKRSASAERAIKNKKLFDEMEESIAMLLQYGEEYKPKPVPRKNISKDVEPRRRATQEIRRPVPQFPMSESIYDNMCNKPRLAEKDSPIVSKRENVVKATVVTAAKASMEDLGDSKDDDSLAIPMSAQRAGSCELLNKIPESPSAGLRDKLKLAEKEAIEVCQWLIQAGFPQYANQYKEGLVPIDLNSVKKDHEFLEPDSLKALFRRLDTLNRCAIMRIDNVVLRRRNDNYAYDMYSCDEDDNVALSGNWQYQRNSHTWSRVANEPMYGAVGRVVSTSQSTAQQNGYRDPYVVKSNRHSPYDERSDHHQVRMDRYDQQHQNEQLSTSDLPASKLSRSQSERIKDTARAFMKRMNPRSGSRRRRESRTRDASQLKISEPVLLSYDSASPECMQMMNRVQRPNMMQERGRSLADRPSRSNTNRRQGVLLLTPTSPESSPNDDLIRGMRHRDRSMPPRAYYDSQASYANHTGYGYDRSRRDRSIVDDYLYQDSPITSARSRATYLRQPYLDTSFSPLYGSGASSPIYSSPYSSRSFATPPSRSRQQLNIQADGYFVHGSSFEISPDTTTTRKTRPFTSSPSTSGTVLAPQLRVDTLRNKSQSSLENTDEEQCGVAPSNQNRRDSGVGSSLSRSPSGPSSQRIRQSVLSYYQTLTSSLTSSSNSSSMGSWNGTATKRRITTSDRIMTSSLTSCSGEDIFFSDEQLLTTIDGLSCFDLTKMRKLAFLRMTAILEKYMGVTNAIKFEPYNASSGSSNVGSGTHKNNWTVQKLIKKIKQMDTKTGKETEESTVFGQSLEVIYRRSGRCLPRTILEILRYLRQMAPDTVGMFRKNGVKSRINELRAVCDRDAETDVFVESQRLDAGQVHDVADLLKQYLRELPNPLMTSRLSEVFAGIFLHVPDNESIRLSALQFAILLLPDENREALQTLLLFLADVAKYSAVNSMPAQNLSVCFTPSLFHLSASRLDKISANRRHKTIGSAYGMPTEREMKETRAAQMCLTFMIQHVRSIFLVPETVNVDRKESEEDAPLLKDLGPHGPRAYLMERVTDLIQENAERWKGWIVEGHLDGVEISSRKPTDDQPLRPIRVWVDVPAPPKEVMHRILRERSVWDVDVINWRVIDTVYPPDTDVHQYVLNDTIGHPTRDCYVVRHHRMDMPELPGACAVAERSIQCGETQLLGGVSATVFDIRFLIEPKSGYSRVTYLARVDLKGRSSTWYNRVYGNVLARQMARLRESFRKTDEYGPETKV